MYEETRIVFDNRGRIHSSRPSFNVLNPPGTAVERPDGSLECWHRGRLHREGGPAVLFRGEQLTLEIPWTRIRLRGPADLWFYRGRLHRDDGPAVEDAQETRMWFLDGKVHREDGPAIQDNDKQITWWWRNGVPHREGAPAVIHDGFEMEWDDLVLFGRAEIWVREGEIHRDGGPAIFDAVGNELWYQNGKLHREDGPAVISDPEQPADLNNGGGWFRKGKLVKQEPSPPPPNPHTRVRRAGGKRRR